MMIGHAIYGNMIMKPYLKIELIEGREELCDCTNAFVSNVDAVGHLGEQR